MVLCIYVYTYIRTYVYMVICIYVSMVVDRTENVFLRKMLDMKAFSRYPRQDIASQTGLTHYRQDEMKTFSYRQDS